MMAAGATSVSSLIYDRTCPDHNLSATLFWKGTVIALATVCTGLAAKALKGRADISMQAAAKFGVIEFVFAAIITKVTHETILQRQHRYYTTHNEEWRLGNIDQTSLVKAFYEAGLPAISLIDIPLRDENFFDSPEHLFANLETYSAAQLSWYREIFPTINIPQDKFEYYFRFMMRCQECGIETLRWKMPKTAQDFLQEHPYYYNMLYQEFLQTPLYRFCCSVDFEVPFQDKKPLPTLEKLIGNLQTYTIAAMDPTFLQMWYQVFIENPDQWKGLSASIQTAFVKHFFDYQSFQVEQVFADSPGSLTWINTLSSIVPHKLPYTQIGWIHVLGNSSQAANELTPETLAIIKDNYQLLA